MFERLSERMQGAFRELSGRGKLSEKNISDAMRDVRRALLEADVNYKVARDFVNRVKEECLGESVLKSVTPGQQAVKIVNDELVRLLGESNVPLELSGKPAVVMLVGLHGSGKTTTAAKLAKLLSEKHQHRPLLAAADIHRPAAIHQLEVLGRDLDIPVYTEKDADDVARIAVNARNHARDAGNDVVIVDTAGRLQVDTDLVEELIDMRRRTEAGEILLVADAALGQEAVSVAEHFDQALDISGIILTKLDGDARGGAALSMRQVTGKPIKFIGVGERPVDFEAFHPERLASRILGMGDVVGLVEKAADQFEEEEAEKLEEKIRENRFDFNDFLDQISRIRKMGGFMSLLDMLPGMGKMKGELDVDEGQFQRIEGIICSMTPAEREDPDLIRISRRRRIARGSGVELNEVNQLLKQFTMMRKVMGSVGKGKKGFPGMGGGLPGMGGAEGLQGALGDMGGLGGGGMPGMPGMGGGKGKRSTQSKKSKKTQRKKKRKSRKKNRRR